MGDDKPAPGEGRPDMVTVARFRAVALGAQDRAPDLAVYVLALRSTVARLAAGWEDDGAGPQAITSLLGRELHVVLGPPEDIGPGALLLCQAADRKRDEFRTVLWAVVGVAQGGRWLAWFPPAPTEPVPGSLAARAAGN
jgi:hypothetical protein